MERKYRGKQLKKDDAWVTSWKQEERKWMKDDMVTYSKCPGQRMRTTWTLQLQFFVRECILTRKRKIQWLRGHIPWDKGSEIGWLLEMQYLESDGSNYEIYSVTDRKPVEISENRRNMAKARFLGNYPSKCVLDKLQASQNWNRRASQERVTVVESRTHYCGSYCLASLSGEGRTDVTECTNVKIRCLASFGNLFVKGHPRVKMNTQIFHWWLELDGWIGNWNGFNGFSQGFERFGPWVEKCNGFRLNK